MSGRGGDGLKLRDIDWIRVGERIKAQGYFDSRVIRPSSFTR